MSTTSSDFPHPIYLEHVLKPAYRSASEHLFLPMLAANQAHVVMLAQQNIIAQANARSLLAAIAQVEEAGLESLPYRPGIEDLFFLVEGRLIEICGPEYGGNLQLARSRNDLGHALARMALRPELLSLYQRQLELRATVLDLARRHVNTVMPGYTHTQPAQPVTFAHYLAGVLSFLQRDTLRLGRAYCTVNQSPLGAAAFTGTGFAIDRELSAALLGFAGVMASSQDSIGASDHQTDIAAALTSLAVNLSRVTYDLLFRATRESGAIRIDDSFIQISSIMPQKRNPVVLEHLRARLSRLLGLAQTIVSQCHNIPYGDTQDIEDEIEPTLFTAISTADNILSLYEATFASLQLNEEHLLAEAATGFTTVTELADTLVREAGLPFRTAHHIVSALVQEAVANDLDTVGITTEMLARVSADILDEPLQLDAEILARALDPVAFVEIRTVLGGAAPSATTAVLRTQSEELQADQKWLDDEKQRLAAAAKDPQQQVEKILET
jgi:argininosuccinate lyase